MPASILSQALTLEGLAEFIPWIVLLATAGFGYLVLYKKDAKWTELMTTSSAIVPVFMLIALTMVPAATMGLFGIIEPIMTTVLSIFSGVLLAFVAIAIPTFFLKRFEVI